MVRRGTKTLKKYLRLAGYVRWSRMFAALLLLVGVFIPTLIQISELKAYALSNDVKKVLGAPNKNLSAKFSFDQKNNRWQFNKNGAAALANDIAKQQGSKDADGLAGALSQLTAKQVGGSGKEDTSLYSVDLPVKAQDGITYYDNVSKLSFKMIPTFSTRDAKQVDDRIVYPFSGIGKVVYTAKANGLKEDIVLTEHMGDTLRYDYMLELPDTLEARVLGDGSVGIYSANPALYGNISFSSDEDKARVMDARKNGTKDNLVFGIPAPFIKDQDGRAGSARYELRGKKLTVVASGLKDLHYPLTVDPSVTVTSSTEFQNGNPESNITFGSGDVRRGSITGGTFNAWHYTDNSVDRGTSQNAGSGAANGMITPRHSQSTAVYNGYMYALGGANNSGIITPGSVERAPINSNGTVGTWVASGNLPEQRQEGVAIGYNGFLYIVGGYVGGGTYSADVKFAAINSGDGSLGTWTSANSMPVGRRGHGMTIYNNMMYIVNGCTTAAGSCNASNPTAIVYCASIYATGQVGSWNSTCGTTGLVASDGFTTVAYNGFIYGAGGCATYATFACTSQPTTIQYAKINSDGTVGSWQTTATSFTTGRSIVNMVVSNGYLYLTGSSTTNYTNVMQYAAVHANGDVGTWLSGNSYTTARSNSTMVAYNNYLYIVGGCSTWSTACGGTQNDVQYATIDPAGSITPYSTEADFDTNARNGAAVVAGNGYIYILGGRLNGTGVGTNTGVYAPINANGSIGTWNPTTAFADFRVGPTAVIHGSSLYMVGGSTNTTGTGNCSFADSGVGRTCTKVERATIDSTTGQLTWVDSFTYYVDNPRALLTAVVNGGYFYVIGGIYNNNTNESTEVDYALINSDGTLGTFTKTTAQLSTARGDGVGAVAWNGRIYVVGGRENDTAEYATPNTTSGDITSWAPAGNALPPVGGQSTRTMSVSGSNGYIYVTGGVSTSFTLSNATQVARINADGTMGNWVASQQTMTNNRFDHGSAAYNGVLYVAGGCNTTLCSGSNALKSYQYAKINNGGNGAVGAWTDQGATGAGRIQLGGTSYNGYVYIVGGCTGNLGAGAMACTTAGMQSDVRYAAMGDNGTIGSWASAGASISPARSGLVATAYNGYLYIMGGCSAGSNGDCTTLQSDVQYALICTGTNSGVGGCGATPGTIGTWNTTHSFSTGRYGLSTATYNGYMYVLGGCGATTSGSCSTFQSDVQKALICTGNNSGVGGCGSTAGEVGTWSSAGTDFTTGRLYQSATINNGYLYVIGGCSAMSTAKTCTTFQGDVQYRATDPSTGNLTGGWAVGTSFGPASFGSVALAYNGYIYLVGGCTTISSTNCGTTQDSTLYAPFSARGAIGRWTISSARLSSPRALHAATVSKGYLTVLNGVTQTNSFMTTASTAPLQVQSRISRYSKLITVNPTTDVSGVYYNGSLDGGSSVEYRVAPSSGVFGAATTAAQGTGSEPTPLCGNGSIFYIQVMVTMGDTTNAVYADDYASNVTDITVYYRLNATPPPNLRMNGGKWFYTEMQQPLDICKQ